MGSRGVPAGYKHKWRYRGHWKETKNKNRTWDVDFTALKSRKGSSRGGLPVGSKILWKLEGHQTAEKVSGRAYKTILRAKKRLIRVQVAKRRPRNRRRKR